MFNTVLYIVGTVVGLIILMNLFVLASGWMKKGKTITDLRGELGKKVQAGQRLLVYFYSPSCSACRGMTPVVEKMQKEKKNVQKVNLAKDMDIGRRFGIMGTPATVIVENAKIQKFYLGAKSEQFLRNLIGE